MGSQHKEPDLEASFFFQMTSCQNYAHPKMGGHANPVPPYHEVLEAFLNLWFAKAMVCNRVAFTKTTGSTKMTKTTQTATNRG